jgi:hypothetical protein
MAEPPTKSKIEVAKTKLKPNGDGRANPYSWSGGGSMGGQPQTGSR